jgi:hypothetical protein
MRIITGIILFAVYCFAYSNIFSQEYDFDIPEVEDTGIELNGNLDTKWGLLNTHKTSPFYGIQFFDDPGKKDYLSQYRLDFYLDGIYRYKKLGFFMKTFSQYVKEENLSFSFFELYGSLNFSPRLSASAGKRRFTWGKGYAFNPVGYVNAEKDPENPDLALAGKTSVYVNYNKSFTSSALQNFSATAVILPPIPEMNSKFAPASNIGTAVKLYFLIKNIDVDLMTLLREDEPSRAGFDLSANLKENLEIHAEYSYANDVINYINENEIFSYTRSGSSFLLGLRWLTRFNTTIIGEYYHNNSGLSHDEFSDYLNYLGNIRESNDSELINRAKANMSTIFRSKILMRDYLYLKLMQPEPFDILYTSVSVFSIYNLSDNSFVLSSQISYKPFTNFEFLFWPFFFLGKDNTEYGSKPFKKKLEVWMRFYF